MSTNIQFSLTAVEARDLLASDSNGKSDPYFKIPHNQYGVLDLPGKKHKSKVIKKNLNPVWNHTYEKIEFNPQMCNKLDIEIWDYDTFGKDDLIGKASINLDWMKTEGQNTFDQWIPLTVTTKDKRTKTTQTIQKGSVHVQIKVLYRPQNIPTQQAVGQQPMYQYPNQQPMYPSQQGQPMPGQPPMGQPLPGQPQVQPPPGQPPMGQPLPGQPQVQPPPGQPPMGQPLPGELNPLQANLQWDNLYQVNLKFNLLLANLQWDNLCQANLKFNLLHINLKFSLFQAKGPFKPHLDSLQ